MKVIYNKIIPFRKGKNNIRKPQKTVRKPYGFCQENEIMFEIGIVGFLKIWYNTL